MKRLVKKSEIENMTGKTIKFLEDTYYGELEDFNPNDKGSFTGGIVFNDEISDDMNEGEFNGLSEYLKSINFIKGTEIVIPAGTIATVKYDNHGNDVDLEFTNQLIMPMLHSFIYKPEDRTSEENILIEIVK